MNARSLLAAVLGLALAASAGCGDKPLAPTIPVDPPAAPGRIVLAGIPLTLDTYLWRDFMPISPPDGRPMTARFRVHSADGSPLPAGLTIESASVYYRHARWLSFPERVVTNDSTLADAVSRGGPKWGPGVTVDVVITVSLGGRQQAMLSARDQLVRRTD